MDELAAMDAELEKLADDQRSAPRQTLPVTFSTEATLDEAETAKQGRPVYKDVEIIEIKVGMDTIRHPVTEAEKKQHALQYLTWKKGEDQESVQGFPLAQWAAIPGKAVVKEFAYFGIKTVEQLAAATDSTIQRIGPHLALRQKAKDWVADAEKQAPLLKLRDENAVLRQRLETLEGMFAKQTKEIEAARQNGGNLPPPPVDDSRMKALEAQLAALAAAVQPKPRGRPKKATNGA